MNIVRNFHVDAWKTRGHMRTYKSGKTVYIKETTHHRKAHNNRKGVYNINDLKYILQRKLNYVERNQLF